MERSTKLRERCTLARTQSHWRLALLLVAPFLGCGGLVGSPQLPPSSVAVTVTPATASILLGEPQVFTAAVGNTTNTSVNWSVNGIAGGSAAVGTIDANGIYTAPVNLPSPVSVSVQATSVADGSKASSSLVTITSDISVLVTPQAMLVELGASRPFAATVTSDGNPNRAVNWNISGSGCAGVSCGAVDSSGTYTAPQILVAPPAVTLTATSAADPSKSGSGAIAITSSFLLAMAGPSSLTAGNTGNYTATLTPAANSNPSRVITWSAAGPGCTGAACGAISSSGVFVAPAVTPSPAVIQITATPQADPSKAVSVSVALVPEISVSISPTAATVALGAAQSFQAMVTGALDDTVTWDVNGAVGGSSGVGLIINSQTSPDNTTYTAPLNMLSAGSVTVRARSNAAPDISANVTVTFTTSTNVTLTPASNTLALGQRQTFAVQVHNTPNQNVTWQVNGIAGGTSSTGEICAVASNPCQPLSSSNGGSVDYIAPAGVPSPNPVTITATSQADATRAASASVTILPHIVVSIQPGSAMVPEAGQLRFIATVTGTDSQQIVWQVTGAGCGDPPACGLIDSSGLYTAPPALPAPNLIDIMATSSVDTNQSATATATITSGPAIFSLSPTSSYAGSAGGFTLLVSGNNFIASDPGPGSILLVGGTARATSCASSTQCITSLTASDLQTAGILPVQLENSDGTLSNTQAFVVLAPGSGASVIPLTPGSPTSNENDIVVVELSSNGGSGATGNVSLNIGAIGPYSAETSSCALGGSPIVVQPPTTGTASADMCVFSVSALDPSFLYTISGPPTPDINISNREPLGLGILHLTLQVPATAAAGSRTLFVENPESDLAAGTGVIGVQ